VVAIIEPAAFCQRPQTCDDAQMPGPQRISADAVVVGSGAGGAPVAAVLAEAGFDVVLLEAGPRIETREFTGDEGEMTAKLWKMGFAVDSGLSLYAGACVGGSTVINDALCFRTPPEVLDRWRQEHHLIGLSESEFAPFVERAWQDLHAEETGPDNTSKNAAALARGAAKLGWLAGPTPRSVKSCANFGLCNYGCPTGAKQSTLVTYVPRAERAGARVIAGVRVERVRVEAGAARGVDAVTADGSPLTVDAAFVCLAAGVLSTPVILQRSGITAGDGVQCHGSVHVSARFAEEIHGYYGPSMAYAVQEFADVAGGRGPGVMIENTSAHQVSTASSLAGFGDEHGAKMAALPHLARALIVMRDRTRGRVETDGSVRYAPTLEDLEVLRHGMLAAARCYLAAGAEEVWLPVHGTAAVRSERDIDALSSMAFTSRGLAHHYAVHLFGGAVMGHSADAGVCDESGACFAARGLYVTDASSFPSNTGVNPQITIVANALRIAGGIAGRGRPT
jgi:choline dehydrogenase-like flavoprotein